jgi:hypothetical protein
VVFESFVVGGPWRRDVLRPEAQCSATTPNDPRRRSPGPINCISRTCQHQPVTVLTWRSAENRGFGHQRAKDKITRGNAGDRMEGTPKFGSRLHFTDSDTPAASVRRLVKNCPRHVPIPPLQPVSVMCALSTRRRRTDRVQPGCAADVFAKPWLLKNAALEPQRGRTAIANERRTFQSLDTSITSRRRGEPTAQPNAARLVPYIHRGQSVRPPCR